MEMNVIGKEGGVTEVALEGRADSAGVSKVEARFLAIVCHAEDAALVDLSKVSFLASLGIRMLVSAAKTLNHRGAKMVLFSAQDPVADTLRDAGIDLMIPLATGRDAAVALSRLP